MFDARSIWPLCIAFMLVLAPAAAADEPLDREQALDSLQHASAERRLAGVVRLADVGTMEDANRLVARMSDDDSTVRQIAVAAMWRIWERSGDAAIDALYQQGARQMQEGNLAEAVEIFSAIIGKKAEFAEAWNKRATAYYLMDQYELSMKDCDEVLKRNPNHFGAMSGYAQMLAELDQPERALAYLERAIKINPNMAAAQAWIPTLKQRIELKRRKST